MKRESRDPHAYLSALAAATFALSIAGPAQAHRFEIGSDCCGTLTYDDCQARTTGAPECSGGHVLVDFSGFPFPPPLDCFFGPGCIGPSPAEFQTCKPDIANGQSVACTTNLRSCPGEAGNAICGGNSVCATPQGANIDFCPKPACLGNVVDNTDVDGDGLLDCWETQGIDYDGDGVVDLNLPSFGVSRNRRDVLVELDYFDCNVAGGDCAPPFDGGPPDTHSHKPLTPAVGSGSIAIVQTAFANATNRNPDGTSGVNLVVVVDEALPHRTLCAFDSTCFSQVKVTRFGTPTERANVNALLAKRVAFHYSLWGHDLPGANFGRSGWANQPGSNTIVTLGQFTFGVGSIQDQAGTFMHELGHNLGLGHGGGDQVNFKPNYLSVMNYRWQAGLRMLGAVGNTFDFSRAGLNALNEFSLNEPLGISDGTLQTMWVCPNGNLQVGAGNQPINWDCLQFPNTPTDTGVRGDINGDRLCVLPGKNRKIDSPVNGDDFIAKGRIDPGPDLLLQTVPAGDDFIVGGSITQGFDGILQTVPAAGSDDLLLDAVIWDGPNRICQTPILPGTDDTADPAQPSFAVPRTEPPTLTGFDDWANMKFDFSSNLIGFSGGPTPAGAGPELDAETAATIALGNTISDLSISQRSVRNANGTITYTVTMLNAGPDSAVSPTVNDRLSSVATVVSCSVAPPGKCIAVGNYLAVSFPSLTPGASASAQITVSLAGPAAPGTKSIVSSQLASTDPNISNNVSVACLAPPTFNVVPPTVTISTCSAPNIGQAQANSLCGGQVVVTNNAPAKFPLGHTTVTWSARDTDGNVQSATQTVIAVLGDDPTCCPSGTNVMLGTNASDSLTGTAGVDCILGRGGDDIIDARGGNDLVSGGAGNDNINGGLGNDTIWGGAGIDTIDSSEGDDFIDGGGGGEVNVCAGSSGTNRIVNCQVVSGCTAACCATSSCAF